MNQTPEKSNRLMPPLTDKRRVQWDETPLRRRTASRRSAFSGGRRPPTPSIRFLPLMSPAPPDSRGVGREPTASFDWAVTANLTAALEAVHYEVGDVIRRAGGHDSDYLGAELKMAW